MNLIIPKKIKLLMQKLIDAKFEVVIQGGFVRDSILGLKPKDVDLFTNATGDDIVKVFPNGKVIGNKERQEKILTVIVDGVDVSSYRKNGNRTETTMSLKEHCKTSDYTVNSICCDINGKIIDYNSGVFDVQRHTFGFVGDCQDRINEDPLRLLRGIRLQIIQGLRPTIMTETFIEDNLHLLKDIPNERIKDELLKMLRYKSAVRILKDYNAFKYILPELHDLIGLDAGPHHNEEDCFEHSMLAFENACELSNNPLLNFSILMHDIGKKPSAKVIDGDITFHRHEYEGQKLVKEVMKRLKFSNSHIAYTSTVIRYHMMGPIKKMRSVTFAKICEALDKGNVLPEDMIVMTYSDNQANLTKVRLSFNTFIKQNPFLRQYYEYKYGRIPFGIIDMDVNGKDVIQMGYKPGPKIGEILESTFESIHNGDIINRRDVLIKYIKENFEVVK